MRRIWLAALGLLLITGAEAKPPPVTLEGIRVQLLYQVSGKLSEDFAKSPDALWNSIIGEGAAQEPADDALVSVVLRSVADEENLDKPVTLVVKNDKGKVIAKRVFQAVFIKHHTVVRSLFLPDSTCAGVLTIEASYGGQNKTARIGMRCGE